MHFYAASFGIDPGYVGKLTEIKIGIKFAVDACQQIKVKRRGHAGFIVVGFEQLRARFFQIRPQKKRISGLDNAPDFGQEFYRGIAIEISDRTTEKHYKKMLVTLPMSRHFKQTIEILALETHDTDGINVAQFTLAHNQSRAGYFDRIIECPLPTAEGLEYPAALLAASAAEFGDGDGGIKPFHDLAGV